MRIQWSAWNNDLRQETYLEQRDRVKSLKKRR